MRPKGKYPCELHPSPTCLLSFALQLPRESKGRVLVAVLLGPLNQCLYNAHLVEEDQCPTHPLKMLNLISLKLLLSLSFPPHYYFDWPSNISLSNALVFILLSFAWILLFALPLSVYRHRKTFFLRSSYYSLPSLNIVDTFVIFSASPNTAF